MPDFARVLGPLSLRFTLMALLSVAIMASVFSSRGRAQDHEQERDTSRLLAILFDSGRLVVGMNQELINDESKGDKGFTSAVFEKQVLTVFQQRTGINLSNSGEKIPAPGRRKLPSFIAWKKRQNFQSKVPSQVD